jgi:hypothetical protein
MTTTSDDTRDGAADRPAPAPFAGGRAALTCAAFASIGAGLVHAAAVGIHAEHTGLTRIFVTVAVLQVAAGAWALARAARPAALAVAIVGAGALGGWALTRTTGISWINGLEQAEDPQFADTAAAALAAVSLVGGALTAWRPRPSSVVRVPVALVAALAVIVTVPAMTKATTHDHSAGHEPGEAAHDHGTPAAAPGEAAAADPTAADEHADATSEAGHDDVDHGVVDDVGATVPHHDEHADATGHAHETTSVETPSWPRPWDPAGGIDFSGVPGVSAEQQARAEQLVVDTLAELPRFADPATAVEAGYSSIGDARTGFEHYINRNLIFDDTWLDPSEPESLVYRVDGDARTLVSAMFIASGKAIDDPELLGYGGALMQWHVHDNLCWGLDDDGLPKVVAVTDDHGGTCPAGTVHAGGDNPMVHVWIAPHPCGPFAALEGHGAGQVAGDGTRVDQCDHEHATAGGGEDGTTAAVPYDPELPIDLGGVDGVTQQQQAFAENLVASTVRDLPQWADPASAERAGFRSIGDALSGHEHYIQWDWIDDDVWLDPDAPESLVYERGADGTKQLVAAMFMLPPSTQLADVPDWGGALMQWHIHDDLCFTDDPEAPRVANITSVGGSCRAPLVKMQPAPMIHVWIVPHECGPFAALEGIGGGQIEAGAERWCDTAHGSHDAGD